MSKKATFTNADIAGAVDAFTANCATVMRVMPSTSKHSDITQCTLPGAPQREYVPKLPPLKDHDGSDN